MSAKQDIKRELTRRKLEKAKAIGPEAIRTLAFDKQLAVLDDPATRKAIFCPRRAAKTMTGVLALVETCLKFPGCNTAFIGLTRMSAKGIAWKDGVCYLNDKLGLGLDPNLSEQKFVFPNGSEILVTGIDSDDNDSKKQLGRKLKRVVVDEASMYSVDLRNFIEGILEPALIDQQGDVILSGTASDVCSGLFFDVTQGIEPGWSVHTWQAVDNPHVRDNWLLRLEEIKRLRPLFVKTALFRQHWLNEWVVNQDTQCYRYDPKVNRAASLPKLSSGGWTHVLGVDLGHSPDPSAFVVCAYHQHCSTLFIVYAHSKLEMDFTAVSNEIKRLTTAYSIDQVIIDGSNKQGVAEMQNRHGLSLEAADKREKAEFISLMSDDLIQGKVIVLPGCEGLTEEWSKLVWVSKDGKIVYPRKENPNCSNHLCFVAGTAITTATGKKAIEEITSNDLVLTRQGYRKVARCGETRKTRVMRLQLSSGEEITCTPDHPFWIDATWCRADCMRVGDTLESEDVWKKLYSTALSFTGTRNPTILPTVGISGRTHTTAVCTFTAIFTKRWLDSFLQDGTFIIKTGIRPTIARITWNVARLLIIGNSTLKSGLYGQKRQKIFGFWTGYDLLQKFGMRAKKAVNGIGSMLLKWIGQPAKLLAVCAQRLTNELYTHQEIALFVVPDAVLRIGEIVGKTTSSNNVLRVSKTSAVVNMPNNSAAVYLVGLKIVEEPRIVYNLEIQDCHEYFANGVLVSNCDAALYAWRKSAPHLSDEAPVHTSPQEAIKAKGGWGAYSAQLMEQNLERQIERQESDDAFSFNEECMLSGEDPLRVALNRRRG